MNATPNQPKATPQVNPQTLALLERIAKAEEQNTVSLAALHDEMESLLDTLNATAEANQTVVETWSRIAEVLSRPAQIAAPAATSSQPQPAPDGNYIDFPATSITLAHDDNGQAVYKIKGDRYNKFGVRVWPEILPALGIDVDQLKPGPNPFGAVVRALMGEKGPRKVIGLAPIGPAPVASNGNRKIELRTLKEADEDMPF